MFGVAGAVQECDVVLFGFVQQRLAGLNIISQFDPAPLLKFLPFGRIMAEPATQIVAGRQVLAPGFHVQCLLFDPARPKALREKTRAILFRGRFIHSFDLDHRQFWVEIITPANKEGCPPSPCKTTNDFIFAGAGSGDR
jgi:hypothetical protein